MTLSPARSSAASNPHCYVAMPILPSNSKFILGDLVRLYGIARPVLIKFRIMLNKIIRFHMIPDDLT
jgi:hypothetical protein